MLRSPHASYYPGCARFDPAGVRVEGAGRYFRQTVSGGGAAPEALHGPVLQRAGATAAAADEVQPAGGEAPAGALAAGSALRTGGASAPTAAMDMTGILSADGRVEEAGVFLGLLGFAELGLQLLGRLRPRLLVDDAWGAVLRPSRGGAAPEALLERYRRPPHGPANGGRRRRCGGRGAARGGEAPAGALATRFGPARRPWT